MENSESNLTLWTVGHSTRSADEFGRLLTGNAIKTLVDVRSFPGSRRYPQFNRETLQKDLADLGICYVHSPRLGGRRKQSVNSHNTAWRNDGFRAYADYMETEPFQLGVKELLELAAGGRTVIMCAESLWWRCHRSLISDYLKARQVQVIHILDDKKTEEHPYTTAARIVDGELSYRGLLES